MRRDCVPSARRAELASGTRGRRGTRSLLAPPYCDEARDRRVVQRAVIPQRSVALAESQETRDHVLAARCAHDVSPERDDDAAKATPPERHGLHDAEIVLRRPPTLDLNSGMKGVGEPLVVLQLRRKSLGRGGRTSCEQDRREQHDDSTRLHRQPSLLLAVSIERQYPRVKPDELYASGPASQIDLGFGKPTGRSPRNLSERVRESASTGTTWLARALAWAFQFFRISRRISEPRCRAVFSFESAPRPRHTRRKRANSAVSRHWARL
jgi:hypothetical protein